MTIFSCDSGELNTVGIFSVVRVQAASKKTIRHRLIRIMVKDRINSAYRKNEIPVNN
jgi:hypothetical protein